MTTRAGKPKRMADAVPEPESYAMLLAGLSLVGSIVVRRRKQQG